MRKLLLATTALLALAAVPAKADTFTAIDYTVLGGQNVFLTSPKAENVSAGEIHLIGAGNTFMDVWCLDVFDNIVKPYTYDINVYHAGDVRPGIQVLDAATLRQIAALMYLGDTGSGVNKAAIQLAIWRTEYGALFGSNASGALLADETSYLTKTSFGGVFDRGDLVLTVLTDDPQISSQAFGNVTLAAAAPEPATWFMMILGFVGVGGLAMRRKGQLRLA